LILKIAMTSALSTNKQVQPWHLILLIFLDHRHSVSPLAHVSLIKIVDDKGKFFLGNNELDSAHVIRSSRL
jgi:hypothetical protein